MSPALRDFLVGAVAGLVGCGVAIARGTDELDLVLVPVIGLVTGLLSIGQGWIRRRSRRRAQEVRRERGLPEPGSTSLSEQWRRSPVGTVLTVVLCVAAVVALGWFRLAT
ncbi:hypothetical protein [Nocardioides sp.]|uniref:hypothetical protein n=1 Tax=Nocardioides sp. TaxID=35761 RepID=UPI00272789CE|nr:hypothetical protein [Nocardioides sp.]MDO9457292.1 hypothetical protein [Nocardioides sp.]